MFNPQTLTSALALSEQYAESGKVLVARPNTVLNELVRLSDPEHEESTEATHELYFDSVYANAAGTLDEPSQHSLQLDGFVRDISASVTNYVNYAKNTVKPLVMEFAENIIAFKENNSVNCPSEKFNVISLDIPDLLKEEMFLDSLEYYKGRAPIRPELKFDLAAKSQEELLTIITTGHAKTDKQILEWLGTLDHDFLNLVWVSFFTSTGNPREVISYDDIEKTNVYDKSNHALAIYLLARKLYDNVDESAKDIGLSVYKNIAVQIRDYAGAVLAASVVKMAMFNSSKSLVIELLPERYTVKVNGSVYKEWLKSGGSPEIILGLVVTGEQITSQSLIDMKAKELTDRWNSYCAFYKTDQSNKAFDHFKDFLSSNFMSMLNNLTEAETEYTQTNPNYFSTVKRLVEEQLSNLRSSDINEVHDVALCLIAKCRFFYTPAYEILKDINDAAKINPNVDVREAALLAVINYVADYLADQIAVAV